MAAIKKDTRFLLTSFRDGDAQKTNDYEYFEWEIKNNGWYVFNIDNYKVKIYTASLALIFISKELQARNMDNKQGTTVNGMDYLNTYLEAYKEGEQYFENEIKVSQNTLYGENAEPYVQGLHSNFFHIQHRSPSEGWVFVKRSYPFILTHKTVGEFGYYSGIVSKVEEQVKKHPQLFATFYKCEQNTPPQQAETKSDKLKADLGKYGFFELELVKPLSEPNKQNLIELISSNNLPYSIAMFDFLGFLKHIETEHFKTKTKLNKEVAKWFNSDKDGRAVKGNISSLSDYSAENKTKYTAHTHKETAIKDYRKLK